MNYDRSHAGSPVLPPQPLHSAPGLVMAAGRGESVTRAHARAAHVGLCPASAAPLTPGTLGTPCRMPVRPVFDRHRSWDTGPHALPRPWGATSRSPQTKTHRSRTTSCHYRQRSPTTLPPLAALSLPPSAAALSWVVSCLRSWLQEGVKSGPPYRYTPALTPGVILVSRRPPQFLGLT